MKAVDIHTRNWQLSLKKSDSVVTDVEDVDQCIKVILSTIPGEDPLRPHFGSRIFEHIDKPIPVAIPNMKMEIIRSLRLYEPRVTVKKITHKVIPPAQILFNIGYITSGGNEEYTEISVDDITSVQTLVLEGEYKEGDFRYFTNLSLDGEEKVPLSPVTGFGSIQALFSWIQDNWSIYGNWHLLTLYKKIIGYINPDSADSGSFIIESNSNVLSAEFPVLEINESYIIVFTDSNNKRVEPFDNTGYETLQDTLFYATQNYADFGEWGIEDNRLILIGSIDLTGYGLEILKVSINAAFSDGFDSGFEI